MKQIAVIDLETTGLNPYRYDRIVEIAIVLMHPEHGILSEINTLVNPERDVGPTSIHGLTASDIINAPRFCEIAGHLTDVLRCSDVLAGHNLRFDISFLKTEYGRIGVEMPDYATIDTMHLSGGGSLSTCCGSHGIDFDGRAHAALYDARATARLLQTMFCQTPEIAQHYQSCLPPSWPYVQPATASFATRMSIVQKAVPTYVQCLSRGLSPGSVDLASAEGEKDYRSLLWNVLEDGWIEESEGEALFEVARRWGLSFEVANRIHLEYLLCLAREAMSDCVLSNAEHKEIQLVAQSLGFGTLSEEQLENLLISHEGNVDPLEASAEKLSGKTVCFTGECACSIGGSIIRRGQAERMALEKGLQIMESVTRKLDILVVADPNTQSGKARKARQYGTRILHETKFWRILGVAVD
jgi:DNA polymerase III subunit epsilon